MVNVYDLGVKLVILNNISQLVKTVVAGTGNQVAARILDLVGF